MIYLHAAGNQRPTLAVQNKQQSAKLQTAKHAAARAASSEHAQSLEEKTPAWSKKSSPQEGKHGLTSSNEENRGSAAST